MSDRLHAASRIEYSLVTVLSQEAFAPQYYSRTSHNTDLLIGCVGHYRVVVRWDDVRRLPEDPPCMPVLNALRPLLSKSFPGALFAQRELNPTKLSEPP